MQSPFLHLTVGSGQAVQYHPEANSEARLHPWHSSTIWWQSPPLKEQPFLVIKMHSNPSFTLVQTIGITPLHLVSSNDFANQKQKSRRTYQPILGLSTRFWTLRGNGVLSGRPCSSKNPVFYELKTFSVAGFLHEMFGRAPVRKLLLYLNKFHDSNFSRISGISDSPSSYREVPHDI